MDLRVPYKEGKDTPVVDINWDVDDSDTELDSEKNREKLGEKESKKRALEALKTWRTEVLPQLSRGMILKSNTFG